MCTNKKRISVCIAAYEPNDYLIKEIETIMPQLSDNDEIVISEDYSVHSPIYERISQMNGGVKIIYHNKTKEKNCAKLSGDQKGYAVTLNFLNAIRHAAGEYIFLADQDDLWQPNRVSKVLQTLEENKGYLVVCNADLIDGEGIAMNRFIRYTNPLEGKFPLINCLKRPPFIGCTMAFDRQLLDYVLPFPKKLNTHDTWITLCAIWLKRIVIVKEPLHLYRIHNNNVSGHMRNPLLYKIQYRAYLAKELLFRIVTLKLRDR